MYPQRTRLLHPLEEHKAWLGYFWDKFGGNKSNGRDYSRAEKLNALLLVQEMAVIRYKKGESREEVRAKFDKVKRKRHNIRFYKRCFVCEAPSEHRHHIIPLYNGGKNSKRNLVSLCANCHAAVHPWMKNRV